MAIVTVTQEFIDKAEKGNGDCCPIALALKTLIPDEFKVSVMYKTVHVVSNTYRSYRTLPLEEREQEFIVAFDKGEAVAPYVFEFDIELPNSTDDGRRYDAPLLEDDLTSLPVELFH
jgi:hypothetical protein